MTARSGGALLTLLCGLAACSESSRDPREAYDDRFEDAIDLGNRIDEAFPTREENMSTSGRARFEGATAVGFDFGPEGTRSSLIGDTALTADFGAGTLTGSASDFVGVVRGGPAEEFDGALTMGGGRIDGNEATGRMQGTLSSDDHRVGVDAIVDGQFFRNPDPLAIGLDSGTTVFTLDGTPVFGSVVVVGERD